MKKTPFLDEMDEYSHRSPSYLSLAIILTQVVSFPAILAAKLATEGGKALLHQLNGYQKVREPKPSPSLRGTPSAEDIRSAYALRPRSICTALRIGSRLADLEPSVDHSLIFEVLPNGKRVIIARHSGIKGWLEGHRIHVTYSTVMRYKKLATRLRQACQIDARIPLEWLLPDYQEAVPHIPKNLQEAYAAGKQAVEAFLSKTLTLTALTKAVEKKLGIVRLVTVRKTRRTHRGHVARKSKKAKALSIQSQHCANGHSVGMAPDRLAATMAKLKAVYGPWLKGHGKSKAGLKA